MYPFIYPLLSPFDLSCDSFRREAPFWRAISKLLSARRTRLDPWVYDACVADPVVVGAGEDLWGRGKGGGRG
jgi:hypothetical protein